jgi:lysophospholipase L1-like esterase
MERAGRHERWFKLVILGATAGTIAALFILLPQGRYLLASVQSLAQRLAESTLALPASREQIDDDWRRFRLQGIADSRRALVRNYEKANPAYQGLMRYAGLDPENGLLRWGNYNRTLLLPSTVFEAADDGRSFRLLRCIESIWLREVRVEPGVLMFFLVPDRPELAEAIHGTGAIPVSASRQTTNGWGLRGQEPELEAPVRGIVLGDSFMQGLFIGDDETPPECLKRYLEGELKTKASVLNTGVLGYSPEQYYYSLLAFADRFRPQFVVVSVTANDFGDAFEAMRGIGDWEEGKHWLEKIEAYCRERRWPCLFVTVPSESQMLGRRKNGHYPGILSNVLSANALTFLDPTEAFINAHLELVVAGQRGGRPVYGCPLFNGELGDGHFSAKGAEVWASVVGKRLVLLLERDRGATREHRESERM